LDLTLISDGYYLAGSDVVTLWRGPLVWITATSGSPHRQDPLPLAMADRDRHAAKGQNCEWASAAMEALERAGRRYRLAYTSGSQVGTHAPVIAGLAVTVSTLSWLPDGLRPLRPDEGLPALPDFAIRMLKAQHPSQPVTDALAARIEEKFQTTVRRSSALAVGVRSRAGMLKDQAGRVGPAGSTYSTAAPSDPSGGALALVRRWSASRTPAGAGLSRIRSPSSPSPSWPGVSRPPAPSRWDRCGGSTTAGAWVAGTRPAMTILWDDPCPTIVILMPMTTPGHHDMAPPVRQRLRRLALQPELHRMQDNGGDHAGDDIIRHDAERAVLAIRPADGTELGDVEKPERHEGRHQSGRRDVREAQHGDPLPREFVDHHPTRIADHARGLHRPDPAADRQDGRGQEQPRRDHQQQHADRHGRRGGDGSRGKGGKAGAEASGDQPCEGHAVRSRKSR